MKPLPSMIVALLLCLPSTTSHARDYFVPPSGPGSSIQASIDTCRPGDRILLASGVYGQRVNITKAITLQGTGTDTTILDGQGTGPVVQVTCPGTVRISRCTIRNGTIDAPPDRPAKGGGIYNPRASLHLNDVRVSSNSAAEGGGVFNGGTLFISRSVVADNTAPQGGGISNTGMLTLTDCVLTNNVGPTAYLIHQTGSFAGGIYNEGVATVVRCHLVCNRADDGGGIGNNGFLRIIDSLLTQNSADAGGGVFNETSGRLETDGSTYRANGGFGRNKSPGTHGYPSSVHGLGGALYNLSTASVRSCLFDANLTTGVSCWNGRGGAFGGAIFNEIPGELRVERSSFHSNSVQGSAWWGYGSSPTDAGGGAVCNRSLAALSNCAFMANWAQGVEPGMYYNGDLDGGALLNNGTAVVSHCTFLSNALLPIGDMPTHYAGSAICAFGPVVIGNSIVDDRATSDVRSCWGALVSAGWNLFEDTSAITTFMAQTTDRVNVDAQLGPIVQVFHGQLACLLKPGSLALDSGSVAGARFDQRGLRRPRNLAQYSNTTDGSDIGALEMLNHDVSLTLESTASTSTPSRTEFRNAVQNVGVKPLRQVMVSVLLPASSRLVSCSGGTVASKFSRLVILTAGAMPAGERVEIGLVITPFASGILSAGAYSSPADEFMANNTMTLSAP